MSKRKKCKYCEAGNQLRDGEHWIVTSLFPPKISIKRCTNMPRCEEPKSVTPKAEAS